MAMDGGKKRRRAGTVDHCDYLKVDFHLFLKPKCNTDLELTIFHGEAMALLSVNTNNHPLSYFKERKKSSNRRRADPVVSMSSIFESVLNEMRDLPDVSALLTYVLGNLFCTVKSVHQISTISSSFILDDFISVLPNL